MEIKTKKQHGLSLIEFLFCLAFVLGFSFLIIGIYEYTRISYVLDEILENELGNKNRFVIKIDQDLVPLNGEVEELRNEIEVDMRNRISNQIDFFITDTRCNETKEIETELVEKEDDATDFNENLISYYDRKKGTRVSPSKLYYIRIQASVDRDACARSAARFLYLMDPRITSTRETLVDYRF